MAPDKIYLWLNPLEKNEPFSAWHYVPLAENSIEYIRKDALLELINKKLQESADRLDHRTYKAYAEILDILNEM